MRSDVGTIRISVVIHESLDPEVYTLLSAISIPRVRSEYARRLLRDGALREFKSKKQGTPNKDANAKVGRTSGVNEDRRPKKREPVTTTERQPPLAQTFSDEFLKGISGVPAR